MPIPNREYLTDRDYLIRVHGGVYGPGGVFERLERIEQAIDKNRGTAYEAKNMAENALRKSEENGERINRLSGLNAAWSTLVGTIAGVINFVR